MAKKRKLIPRLATILATFLVALGLLLGLGYDRQGSVELFFSGLALFLLKDTLDHKATPYFREHLGLFRVVVASFSLGFSIFIVMAAIVLSLANLQSFQKERLTINVLGVALLFLGTGPYLSWILKSRK